MKSENNISLLYVYYKRASAAFKQKIFGRQDPNVMK